MTYLIVDALSLFVVLCNDTAEEMRSVLDAIEPCLRGENMRGSV